MDVSETRAMALIATILRSRGWVGECAAQILEQDLTAMRLTGADVIEVVTAAFAPPAGYALVPLQITDEMAVEFAEAWFSKERPIDDCDMQDAWTAALAARPEVPGA